MRIGIFTDFYMPHMGGVSTSVERQAHALRHAGHDVWIIAPKDQRPHKDHQQVVRLPSLQLRQQGEKMAVYVWSVGVFQRIDTLKLDVIHAQTEFGIGMLALRYAKKRQLPLVYTPHTFYPPQLTHLYRFPLLSMLPLLAMQWLLLRPRQVFAGGDWPKEYVGISLATTAQRSMARWWLTYAQQADVIVAASKRMDQFMELFLPEKTILHIPNPTDRLQQRRGTPVEPAGKKLNLVWVGRIAADKSPLTALQALSLLERHDRAHFHITYIGDGPQLHELQAFAQQHDVRRSVTFMGRLQSSVVAKELAKHDIMLVTSHGFDNQPMVIVEALQAGLAIVYCDNHLRDGLTAANAVFSQPLPSSLAQTLRNLAKQPARVTAMKHASLRIIPTFAPQLFARRYGSVLKACGIISRKQL